MAFTPWRRVALLRKVIVNLDDGSSIAGVLYDQRGPLLILRQAEYLIGRAEPVPMDGDVLVDTARVLFVQAP